MYDCKTDIRSFGAIAMELADGELPYIKVHHQRALKNIVTNVSPRIHKKRTSSFQVFIEKCLDKDT